jgi:hypothetical protein
VILEMLDLFQQCCTFPADVIRQFICAAGTMRGALYQEAGCDCLTMVGVWAHLLSLNILYTAQHVLF